MTIIILSNFFGFILKEKFNLPYILRHNLNLERIGNAKVFKCLPCFTFWLSVCFAAFFYLENVYSLKQCGLEIMAAYILAIFLDNR